MNRRASVFVSSADLFALLSIALMGYVIFSEIERERPRLDQLPLVTDAPAAAPLDDEMTSARWHRESGDSCWVITSQPDGQFAVPCEPRRVNKKSAPVSQQHPLRALADRLGQDLSSRPPVLLVCERQAGLAGIKDCARLKWTVHDHGFMPVVAIELE